MKPAWLLLFLLFAILFSGNISNIDKARASEEIFIKADGSIEPTTANIATVDNVTYTLTDNVNNTIAVQRSNIIVDGNGNAVQGSGELNIGISIVSEHVTIKNLTVSGFEWGVYTLKSYNVIADCIITDKMRVGGDFCNVTRCRISHGLQIWYSSRCNIFYNDIENGLLLQGSGANCIFGNRITRSDNGIVGYYAPDNNISGNLVVSCPTGISLGPLGIWDPRGGDPPPYSTGNFIIGNEIILCQSRALALSLAFDTHVYHNNFINNTSALAVDTSTITWDDGYPSGGNFWGDYNGTDAGGDGIGDQPYLIDTSGFADSYPLMARYEDSGLGKLTFGPIAILSATCKAGIFEVGLPWEFVAGRDVEFEFDASSSVPGWNGSRLTRIDIYNWTFGDGSTETTNVPKAVHAYMSGGLFEATATVTDNLGLSGKGSQKVFAIMPTVLTVSTNPASTSIGLIIKISGTLKDFYGRELQNQRVICYYSSPWIDWVPIVSCNTDQNGLYKIEWIPPATGAYTVMADFGGYFPITDYPPLYFRSESYANLNILSSENRYLFSVESNSSVSELLFNSTALELSFNVAGPEGSSGYANVMLAKDPQGTNFDMNVYIDGEQLDHTSTSFEDCWQTSFHYPHSTHKVVVALHALPTPFFDTLLGRALILALSVVAIVTAIVLVTKRKKSTPSTRQASRALVKAVNHRCMFPFRAKL